MTSVNKVIILGRLGADPDTRYTASGSAVTNIRVATSESWKDKQTGEAQERTEWHSVTFFGRLAEIAGDYLKKGSQAYIEGSLRTEKYTDKEGIERYKTSVIAQQLVLLGGGSDQGDLPRRTDRSRRRDDVAGYSRPRHGSRATGDQLEDDEIPF